MTRPITPHPPDESDTELGFAVLAALGWLQRLDSSLPAVGRAAPKLPLADAEAAVLGCISLATRLRQCFEEELAKPAATGRAAKAMDRSSLGWLR